MFTKKTNLKEIDEACEEAMKNPLSRSPSMILCSKKKEVIPRDDNPKGSGLKECLVRQSRTLPILLGFKKIEEKNLSSHVKVLDQPKPKSNSTMAKEAAEAARKLMAEDDLHRQVMWELIVLEIELKTRFEDLGWYAFADLSDYSQEKKRKYHEERKILQDRINVLRKQVPELRAKLPDGYADQLRTPPEVTVTFRF